MYESLRGKKEVILLLFAHDVTNILVPFRSEFVKKTWLGLKFSEKEIASNGKRFSTTVVLLIWSMSMYASSCKLDLA